eukprot:gb/GEZN01004466.1/.p1 GENE.gb/GEZN01004466.1/~~gb/GEZN01004466.1/.p1  ORF type:complete len:599 (-),score=165.67 gb/GEZN01004466.1/:136-1932(-)
MSGRKQKERRKRARAEASKAVVDAEAKRVETAPKKEEPDLEEAREWLKLLKPRDLLNPDFFAQARTAALKADFTGATPFPHLHIPQFLEEAFAKKLLEELTRLEYSLKRNDLFEFAQSDDLKSVDDHKFPLVGKLKEIMYGDEFRNSLKEITGIQVTGLTTEVSMSAAIYQNGHHLLPHDDELQGRRIAYIIYLVVGEEPDTAPPENPHLGAWEEKDGGALALFSVDSQGRPIFPPSKKLVPQWNSIAFFQVSPKSFHQVEEVTSNKLRVSISGWFHGDALPANPTVPEKAPLFYPPAPTPSQIEFWIARDYRKPSVLKRANKQFADESSIQLREFLRKDKYEELLAELKDAEFTRVGPPNKRHYSQILHTPTVADDASSPSLVSSLGQFFLSESFRRLLKDITGLTLSDCFVESRQFKPGDYTLAHDEDPEKEKCALDAVLCCIPRVKWSPAMGGSVHYLAVGEEEELFSETPAPNSLTLVYREGESPGVLRFTKYVNSQAKTARVDFFAVYRDADVGEREGGQNAMEEEEEEEKKGGKAEKKEKKGKKVKAEKVVKEAEEEEEQRGEGQGGEEREGEETVQKASKKKKKKKKKAAA